MTSKSTLVGVLENQLTESEAASSETGEQRERNHRYFAMGALGNEQRGRSHHISPDVLDAVESKKAIFSETFLSARDVVEFTDCPYPMEAEAKTAYVNRTMKRNKYHRLFRDAWHDALVAKRCVVLAEWEEEPETLTTMVQGAPLPAMVMSLEQQGIDPSTLDTSQAQVQRSITTGGIQVDVITGPISVERPAGYVKYTLVQPERYYRDPDAAYNDQSQWETIAEDISRGALIEMGFDEAQVLGLNREHRFRNSEEDSARKHHDRSFTRQRSQNRVDVQETVGYFRTWTWLNYDNETFGDLELGFEAPEGYALYEIHWSSGEILERDGVPAIRVVEESGIFEWTEMKISHAESGMCTSDVQAHTQKTSSVLKRLIIDNQQIANSSRLGVLVGGLKNPRDLLENRIGAPLWMNRPDALRDIPTPQLSPLTFQALAMLKDDGQARSGMNDLAKGMNTDAVRYQNADNMIERLTTAGQRRVTMAARDFANTFLVPLSQYTVKLAMEHDKSQDVMEVAGQQVPIAPSTWQDDTLGMDVAVALTPEEGQRMSQHLLLMHGLMKEDQDMALSYGAAQKHALFDMVFELIGVSDTTQVMLSPNDPRYAQAAQQRSQAQMAQAQEQKKVTDAQVRNLDAQGQGLFQSNQLKAAELEWKRTNEMADNLRADDELDHQKQVDKEKLEIDRDKLSSNSTH
jgi:hypothetical protein